VTAGTNPESAKTIVYVEDNEANRKIVRLLLKNTSYALIEAYDGEAGVATAVERRPDLILMDLQLPKISGLEAMGRIRAHGATAKTPRSLLLPRSPFRAMTGRRWRLEPRPTLRSPTARAILLP
jgi:CheY-like chemotaxis protein